MKFTVEGYDSNVEYLKNTTLNATGISKAICQTWEGVSHPLYQWAHICFLAGFLIPRSQENGVLFLRMCLTIGFCLSTVWAYTVSYCSLDILLWSISFLITNIVHVIWLIYEASPPKVPKELLEVYNRIFIPLKVTKKEFKELVRFAEIKTLLDNERYSVEGVTRIDERLSILLRGKLCVTCENIALHQISPHEFIDSPEYQYTTTFLPNGGIIKERTTNGVRENIEEAEEEEEEMCETRLGKTIEENVKTHIGGHPGDIGLAHSDCLSDSVNQSERISQVTITAMEPSKYLCWDKRKLIEEILPNNIRFKCILHNLIGKDITHKLYLLNEAHRTATEKARSRLMTHTQQRRSSNIPLNRLSKQEIAWWRSQLPRSLSVDAVHINQQQQQQGGRRKSNQMNLSSQTTKLAAVSHLQLLPESSLVTNHHSMGSTLMPPGYYPLSRIPEPSGKIKLGDGDDGNEEDDDEDDKLNGINSGGAIFTNNVQCGKQQTMIPSINVINASRLNISRSKEDYFNEDFSDKEEDEAQKEPLLGTQMIKLKAFGF